MLEESSTPNNDLENVTGIIKKRLALLNLFRKINQKMNLGLPIDAILNEIFTNLSPIIPYDRMGIALLEDEGKMIRLKWVRSKTEVQHLMENYAVFMSDTSLGEVLNSNTPRILNDLAEYYRFHPKSHSTRLLLLDGIRSSLTCPLMVRGEPVGVVFFSSCNPYTYENIHIDQFREIAESLSVITEYGMAQSKETKDHEKDQKFKDVLHDLKNPLSVINGTIELISHQEWFKELPEKSKTFLNILSRNSDAMIQLLNGQLISPAPLNQQPEASGGKTLFDDYLDEINTDFKMMAKTKNISVRLNKLSTLPELICFDAFRIKEAILNYMSNAIKFSKPETEVSLDVYFNSEEQKVYFIVVDQGLGIKEEEQSKLFKDYSTTTTRPTSGEPSTGLGLAIVKRIINQAGGEVFVSSKPGMGSSFGFWLPCFH